MNDRTHKHAHPPDSDLNAGYIGGSILARFLEHPDFALFKITALVRSPEKAEKIRALGVDAVVGSHNDSELMQSLTASNDVVFSTTDSDDHEAIIATLKGMKKRHDETGSVPILIHTVGFLIDDAKGLYATETIYDDLKPDQINALPDTQFHRNIDLEILRADEAGYIKSYIVLPSTIWGISDGPLVKKGIQNPISMQVPQLIRASLTRGRAGMVGEGKNIWPDVNIDEVADLYVVLFNAIRANPDGIAHGREGYFFGESGEHTMYEVAKAIGEALVALGKSDNPEPSTFTKEEVEKYLGGSDYLGTNSRCSGNRPRALGWKPVKTKDDFLASIRAEVEYQINISK
ncbi:NAD-binding protein [Agrocybe pediades]|nr:NAD-binding protein [Agrocybe pediades]